MAGYARADVPVVVVAALGRDGTIGKAGALPWTMPGDLARFRALTMGTPMIMGRRTWDSIGRPLPDRESVVVSRDAGLTLPEGVWRADGPTQALALGRERARVTGASAISLIGGATLFDALIWQADRLALTIVDLVPEGDTFFPAIDPASWREVARVIPARHPSDEASCTFVDYVRASPKP